MDRVHDGIARLTLQLGTAEALPLHNNNPWRSAVPHSAPANGQVKHGSRLRSGPLN
jgi:hypothetical protein